MTDEFGGHATLSTYFRLFLHPSPFSGTQDPEQRVGNPAPVSPHTQWGLPSVAVTLASFSCLYKKSLELLQRGTVPTTAVTRGQNRELSPVGALHLLL